MAGGDDQGGSDRERSEETASDETASDETALERSIQLNTQTVHTEHFKRALVQMEHPKQTSIFKEAAIL